MQGFVCFLGVNNGHISQKMLGFGRFLDVINRYSREEDTGLAVFG
jgi:hypothetical protein